MKIIECPRDAMQGLHPFITTREKVNYLNLLLQVGFDTLDFGSFVSPKAIPQMRDTAKVVQQLNLDATTTKLLAIVANRRGANDAVAFDEITYLGYPFSISETFQMRNTNSTILESVDRVKQIQEICVGKGKQMVVYISMGFGNPYGDEWSVEIVQYWVEQLAKLDIRIFQLSDTVGVAQPDSIEYLFNDLIPKNPNLEIGAHFHTTLDTWEEKIATAYGSGCRRFDGVIRGFGGCPMAQDSLVGNMPSERLIQFAHSKNEALILDFEVYKKAIVVAERMMNRH